jgi:putative membrane protein (TIGR04086 family)
MINSANPSAKTPLNESMDILSVLKGILAAYIITIPTFMLFALLLTNIDFPERLITPVVVVTTILSVLFAGASATKGVKNKGWLNGGIVGFIYMLVLYFIGSLIFNNFSIDKYVITMTVIGVLTGAIGGIIGVNMKKGSKYKRGRA